MLHKGERFMMKRQVCREKGLKRYYIETQFI
jgi:hypothetical protein